MILSFVYQTYDIYIWILGLINFQFILFITFFFQFCSSPWNYINKFYTKLLEVKLLNIRFFLILSTKTDHIDPDKQTKVLLLFFFLLKELIYKIWKNYIQSWCASQLRFHREFFLFKKIIDWMYDENNIVHFFYLYC